LAEFDLSSVDFGKVDVVKVERAANAFVAVSKYS
jgi:hypothetical protein